MTPYHTPAFRRLSLFLCLGIITLASCRHAMPDPPVAEQIQYTDTISGKAIPDPYHWLENQKDSHVLNYARAEINYAAAYFEQISDLREMVRKELDQRGGYSANTESFPAERDTCWGPGKKYLVLTENNTTVKIHQTGTVPSTDRIIYTETRPGFAIDIAFSASQNFLFIRSFSGDMTETRYLPADFRNQKPILIQPCEQGHYYTVEHFGSDVFWILSNDKAPTGKLVQAKILNPEKKFWIPSVIYPDSTILKDFEVINMQYLILSEQKSTRASVRIADLTAIHNPDKGNRIGFKDPDGEVILSGYEQKSGKALFRFSSVVTPLTMYAYDLNKDKLGVRWQTKVNGYIRDNYGTRILPMTTKAGKNVPVTLIFHKDFENRDGNSPLLLTTEDCLGVYGNSRFNPAWVSLLDRGFYIAIVHLRDDPATGNDWQYGQGLADCANFLISEKYTSKGMITASGTNNGAMAVLDAMNNQPDLFKAVILDHPFIDPEMLVANPLKNQPYPPLLILSAGADDQKNGVGTLKTMAMLRNDKTDKNLLLMSSGTPVTTDEKGQWTKPDFTDQITFILSCYGIE